MEKRIISKIREIVCSSTQDNGWAQLSAVGIQLNVQGIKFQEYGFNKLNQLFASMNEIFELSNDDKTNLPIVRVRGTVSVPKSDENAMDETIHLKEWANINERTAIESLKEMALHEIWSFKEADERYPNQVLAQYLKWTFVKLMREDKILYSGKYASFNTGLVDRFYKPIYAVFSKNRFPQQEWYFNDFCVAGSSSQYSRVLANNFSELPERAVYIKNYDDVIYDYSLPVDVNWEHIIIKNIERIPDALIKHICYDKFEVKDVTLWDEANRERYYTDLREFLYSDSSRLSMMTNVMSMAMETARLRVAWNYKTAIPVYYPTDDKVHLILPLSLNINKPEEVSLALVMTKTPSKRYRAVTIFTLEMAYSNARLITKPSSDWLIAESI